MSNLVVKEDYIALPNWYSIDVQIEYSSSGGYKAWQTANDIVPMMEKLINDKIIEKWYFLYEGKFIAVRMKKKSKVSIKKLEKEISTIAMHEGLDYENFEPYQEHKEKMPNTSMIEAFANIMCETTNLWSKKCNFETSFSNYRFMERVAHCMFNQFCGGNKSHKNEAYFLHQRLLERTSSIFDDNFEKINSENIVYNKYVG